MIDLELLVMLGGVLTAAILTLTVIMAARPLNGAVVVLLLVR